MFCKKCGHQNPDDAKFCMSCGASIPIVHEPAVPISESKSASVVTTSNKPNAFQKILFLVSLLWFIVALFYIPYKDDDEIVYDTLWAGRSEKIDLLRAILQFGLLFIVTHFLYCYLRRNNSLEKHRYKKLAKRELFLFFLLVLSVFACGLYLFGTNFINRKRDKKLAEQIAPIEQKIEQNSAKRRLRQEFWNEVNSNDRIPTYEEIMHGDFDNRINRYWDFVELNMEDNEWLLKYYNSFKPSRNIPPFLKENGFEVANQLDIRFKLHSPNALKDFIKNNALRTEDFKKDEESKTLGETLNKLREEKLQLTFYDNKDFRRITLITLTVIFALLYLLRPLFWFVKGLLTEIK